MGEIQANLFHLFAKKIQFKTEKHAYLRIAEPLSRVNPEKIQNLERKQP
jgi:hypothetical protein